MNSDDNPIALEQRAQDADRLFSPSAARNRGPVLGVLRETLPASGAVLEIASGTGEHITFFAEQLPDLRWRPSDPDPASLRSIEAWIAHARLGNVAPPISIRADENEWGVESEAPFDAIISLNMIHIAPWAAAKGLFTGAGRLLRKNGILFLYGPFQDNGRHNAQSNADFDASLKTRNPEWGVRDIVNLQDLAKSNGLTLKKRQAMPANNECLVFELTH